MSRSGVNHAGEIASPSRTVALRRHIVVGGEATRALSQRLFQGQRPAVFTQEVCESFVGKGLEGLAAITCQQKQGLPNLGPEFDQFTFGIVAACRAEHASILTQFESALQHNRFVAFEAGPRETPRDPLAPVPLRYEDTKGPGTGAIMQRRMHEPDLAV